MAPPRNVWLTLPSRMGACGMRSFGSGQSSSTMLTRCQPVYWLSRCVFRIGVAAEEVSVDCHDEHLVRWNRLRIE
jgi:hypothetical protein